MNYTPNTLTANLGSIIGGSGLVRYYIVITAAASHLSAMA